jgi:phosphotransferase system enzyme I (PtsI)/phosphotransferase system enzyme I (PtsP)
LLADLAPGLKYGAEGVGLYRTEIPFLIRDSFPTEDEQVGVYKSVFDAYAGKPVYMRTLDVGGDKQLPYFPTGKEDNPALGWRGIRFTLDNVQLLVTQLRAMLRASVGHDDLHVLIPMVSATSEVDAFRDWLAEALKQLRDAGLAVKTPKVGVMVEVPAAISQIGFWHEKIDFISIGSNDLSQYLLAIDRNNFRVADRFDHVHPAIIHELYRIANAAKEQQLPVCVCGELGSDPIAVALLIGMGISRLSLSSSRLPKIKYFIRHLNATRAEQFLQMALKMDNVQAIRQAGVELLKELGLEDFQA